MFLSEIPNLQPVADSLKMFDANNNRIENITTTAFFNMTSLEHISLAKNNIRSLENISGVPQLTFLDASHNELTEIMDDFSTSIPRLEIFYMSHNAISNIKAVLSSCISSRINSLLFNIKYRTTQTSNIIHGGGVDYMISGFVLPHFSIIIPLSSKLSEIDIF